MTTIIFEKAKAFYVDEEGDVDVEIFQNESGKIGVRLSSIFPWQTDLSCWFYPDLKSAREQFLKMRGHNEN